MNPVKKASSYRTLHGWLTIQWALHLPMVMLFYFFLPHIWAKISILYLALVSIYANAATHWGAWQATRAEVRAEQVKVEQSA